MKLYITDLSLLLLVLFYLPFVLWGLLRIWRTPKLHGFKKAAALIVAVLLAYAIPLGDVTVNSLALAQACPSAGVHIYKTVEVEGYATSIGSQKILEAHPYKFIDVREYTTSGDVWNHFERSADGDIKKIVQRQSAAEYEIVGGEWHIDHVRGVEATTDVIRNRNTLEVLAVRNLFNPLPGWLDKIIVIRWFGTGGRRGCWGEYDSFVDPSSILIPR